jgi:hypothetical protein
MLLVKKNASTHFRSGNPTALVSRISGPVPGWIFWRSTWDKELDHLDGNEKVIRSHDPIDNSLIPDIIPDRCDVMLKPASLKEIWPGLRCEKILIRPDEFKEAEEAALSACAYETALKALMIIGQPGIGSFLSYLTATGSYGPSSGKSTFLLRLLLRRLALELPTVLQVDPTKPCFSTKEA